MSARWYYEMDLGECPPLTPEESREIAIHQSYRIAALLALHEDEYGPDEDQDAIVGPVRIDHANLEAWEESRARDYDVTDEVPY